MKKWACLILCSQLLANPNGAEVISGAVQWEANGPLMEIHASDRSIIHWDDFSIQSGETTRFIQPNSSAAVLNRVTGISPSMINGVLEANGRVILVNPHGVIVGQEGVIRVADFIGSTYDVLDLTDWSIKTDRGNAVHLSSDASVINHEGVIEATGFQSSGGKVLLIADTVHMTGAVVAPQGTVELFGDKVILEKMAAIDVTGEEGGIVRIGDDSLGSITFVGSGVQIHADAKTAGDGGSVILWSGESTQFHGTATAHGGPIHGDGGFIEISSLGTLGCLGKVDASAPHGASGQILFDPCDITIGAAAFGTPFAAVYTPTINPSGILAMAEVEAALNLGSDVTINTSFLAGGTGVVTWLSGNPITWVTSNILTINADSTVVINSSIMSTDPAAELEINSLTGSVNIEPLGVGAAILIEVFGRVEINAGLDVNLITTDGAQMVEVRSIIVNVTAGRSVFLNPPIPMTTPGSAAFQSFNILALPAPITIDAGRDVILGPSSSIVTNNGPIFIKADHNIEMRPTSFISYFVFDANGSFRPITLVVDDQAPTAPQVGDGAFIMDLGSAINIIPGQTGPVQIFTALRNQNTVDGAINSAFFSPGPFDVDTDQERWRVYFPNSFVNPNNPFFTIFYKELQPILIQALQATIAQAFVIFEEFAQPAAGYEDRFCVTECSGARGWSGQEKSTCPWIEIDNYRKFYPSRDKYGFVTIDHEDILPPQCDQ